MKDPKIKDLNKQWHDLAKDGQAIGKQIQDLEASPDTEEKPRKLADLYAQLSITDEQMDELLAQMRQLRILSYKDDPEKILRDAKTIAGKYTKEEFIDYAKRQRRNIDIGVSVIYKQLELGDITEKELQEALPKLHPKMQENFTGACWYLEGQLEFEREALDYYGLDPTGQKLKRIIEQKVSEWYEKPQPLYAPLVNNKATNALAKLNSEALKEDPITHTFLATIDGVHFTLDNRQRSNDSQLIKTMDLLMVRLGEVLQMKAPREILEKTRLFAIPLREYMELCGLSDRKNAREQLTRSLQDLYHTSASWREEIHYNLETGEKLSTPELHTFNSRLLVSIGNPAKPIDNGQAIVELNPRFIEALSQGFIAPLPLYLFKINQHKHPHAYRIGRLFALHENMNIGKGNRHRISVKTILDRLPGIPSYEEVMATSKKVSQLIIEPIERDLDALQDEYNGIKWHYCNANGDPLTDEQLENYTYKEWETWLVEFEHIDYPPQKKRLGQIEKKRKNKAKKPSKKVN